MIKLGELHISMVDVLSEDQLGHIGRTFIRSSNLETLLSSNNIDHMIIGAHAIGEITNEPRATQDVDIVVKHEDLNKTINLILSKYSGTHSKGNRIKDKEGNTLIDILTNRHPIYKTAMESGGRIPEPEMVLVMKFLSSTSPLRRKDKKLQDKADFFNVISKIDFDENKLYELLKKADPEHFFNKSKLEGWVEEAT